MNTPPSPVTTTLVALVPLLTIVTVTPGRTPPDESTTRPPMLPRDSCAAKGRGKQPQNGRQDEMRDPRGVP